MNPSAGVGHLQVHCMVALEAPVELSGEPTEEHIQLIILVHRGAETLQLLGVVFEEGAELESE